MVAWVLNGVQVEAAAGSSVLEAAWKAGVAVPTLCHHPDLEPSVSCFLCVVAVEGSERLVPACATRLEQGMSVWTHTPEVLDARRTALELLLSDHTGECSAPCRLACPAGLDVAYLFWLLTRGRREEAGRLARDGLLLPATLGFVCAGYCQRACRRAEVDRAIAIAETHRALGVEFAEPEVLPGSAGPSVAVVGAGPAGLAAAATLRRARRAVVLFEKEQAGGGLWHSVEQGALERSLLQTECERLLQGVTFRPLPALGRELPLETLLKDHAAVLVASGGPEALEGRTLDRRSGASAVAGLFAAGETLAPMGRAAVRAVASGRRSAQSALRFLQGQPPSGPDPETAPGRAVQVRYRGLDEQERALLLEQPETIPVGRMDDPLAREAGRCLRCGCVREQTCRLRIEASAHGARPGRFSGARRRLARDRGHPRVVLESGKCILCGICVGIAAKRGERAGLVFHGRGFATKVAPPFEAPLARELGPAAEEGASACPTGALSSIEGLEQDRGEAKLPGAG